MLLSPTSLHRGGKSGISHLKTIFRKFLAFKWDQLVQLDRLPAGKSHSNQAQTDQIKQAALRLVKCGELSRAARVLTSSGLAPVSEDTISRLANKHPSRVKDIQDCFQGNSERAGIQITTHQLSAAIMSAPRGSSPGPSGWRYEHCRVLLQNSTTLRGLNHICSLIAKGTLPVCAIRILTDRQKDFRGFWRKNSQQYYSDATLESSSTS